MRIEAKRLADVILRLAADDGTEISTRPGRYCIEDMVGMSGDDELVIGWEHDCQRVVATDAQGQIPLGLRIDDVHIGRGGRTLQHVPADFVEIASMISETVTRNPALPHDELHIVLGDAEAWDKAGHLLHEASDANPDLTLTLGVSTERGMHLDIKANGSHGVSGPSATLTAAVSALPTSPILTWTRAESAQALAKRRQHGVPPMGWATIRPARIVWKAHGRPAADKGGSHVVRPAIPVARIQPVPVTDDRRFEWVLEDWEDVKFFSELKPELQQALEPILVVNEQTLIQQLQLVRRNGRWTQRYAKRGEALTLSNEHANTLLAVGLLERRGDRLAAGKTFHLLLEGLVATGHDSWEGVAEIRRVEAVPSGVRYEPQRFTYLRSDGREIARLKDDGFTIESLNFDPKTPTLAKTSYAKSRLKPDDPLIAVVVQGGMAWPDFDRDIRAEMEGRIAVPCDPGLDHRHLPGPLGALYRAPAADRLLIKRYLRWSETRGQLPDFWGWRDDVDDDLL